MLGNTAGTGFNPFSTVTTAMVIEIKKEEDEDKVSVFRVRYLAGWLQDTESGYMRAMTPVAGSQYGVCCWPQLYDEVLVAFLDGDFARPIIIGSLYNNDKNLPPYNIAPNDQKNWINAVKTQTGNAIEIVDSNGMEETEGYEPGIKLTSCGVSQEDSKGSHSFKILTSKDKKGIFLSDREGKNTISLDTSKDGEGKCIIEVEKEITLKVGGKTIVISADSGIEIKSDAKINVEAQSTLDLKASSSTSIEASSTKVQASADMTIKGATVKIN